MWPHPKDDRAIEMAKEDLARGIRRQMVACDWSQLDLAACIGLAPPDVSALVRGNLRRFSLDRLHRFLMRVGIDSWLRIAPPRPPTRRGTFTVMLLEWKDVLDLPPGFADDLSRDPGRPARVIDRGPPSD